MSATSLLGYCNRTMFGAPGGAVAGGVAAPAAGMPGATWAKAPVAAPSRTNATQKSLSTGFFTGSKISRSMQFAYENRSLKLLDAEDQSVIGELHVSRVDPYRAANGAGYSSNRSCKEQRNSFCLTGSGARRHARAHSHPGRKQGRHPPGDHGAADCLEPW